MKQVKRKTEQGSLLVWVSVVLLLITIFSGAVLTISLAYHQRSINNNASRQAYFTARSACNTIGGEICSGTETGKSLLAKLPVGYTVSVPGIDFAQAEMGRCSAQLRRLDEDTIAITATATVGTQTRTVTLRLNRGTSGGGDESPITGFMGLVGREINFGSSLTTGAGTDVYTYGEGNGWGVNLAWGDLQLGGSLYSKQGVSISGGQVGSPLTVGGSIISDGPILLNGYMEITGDVYSTSSTQYISSVHIGGTASPAPGGAAQPSKLPKVTTPDLPECPADANYLTNAGSFASPLGISQRNSYYKVTQNNITADLKTAADAGNLFIYIPDNFTFNLASQEKRATNNGTASPAPNVYFILGENTRLNVRGEEFYGYVFGPDSAKLELAGQVAAYGAAHIGAIRFDQLTFYYMEPTGGIAGGGGSTSEEGEASGFTGFYAEELETEGKNEGFALTGSGDAQFDGDGSLVLNFSAERPLAIEPSFTYNGNLTIQSMDLSFGAITGDLTVNGDLWLDHVKVGTAEKPVNIVCTGRLYLVGETEINGTVTAKELDMEESSSIHGNGAFMTLPSAELQGQISGTVTKIQQIPWKATVPDAPDMLPMPEEDLMEKLTNKTTQVGYVGRDAYYYVPKNSTVNIDALTVAADSGRVVIYVLEDATLKLDKLYDGNIEHPNVVIHLGREAELIYNQKGGTGNTAPPLCAYIYGEEGSEFEIEKNADFYGSFHVGSFSMGDGVTLHYTGDITVGGHPVKPPDETTPTTETWSFGMYLDGEVA